MNALPTLPILKFNLLKPFNLASQKRFQVFKGKERKFSIILGIKLKLLIMSCERKSMIFYSKNLKLTNNHYFSNSFCNWIFSYWRFLPIKKKNESELILAYCFVENIPYNSTVLNFENKKQNFKYSFLLKKKILIVLTIVVITQFNFKIVFFSILNDIISKA